MTAELRAGLGAERRAGGERQARVFLAVGVGMALGLAWRRRAWWLGWALLWLVMAPPEPTPLPLLLLALAGAVATWPPVRWGFSFLRGRGGMGGAVEKGRNGESPGATRRGSGRTALVSWGEEPPPRRWLAPAAGALRARPGGGRCGPPGLPAAGAAGLRHGADGQRRRGQELPPAGPGVAPLPGGAWLGQRVHAGALACSTSTPSWTWTPRRRGGTRSPGGWACAGRRGRSGWWHLPLVLGAPLGPALPPAARSAWSPPRGRRLVARAVRRTRAELVLLDSLTIGSAGAGPERPQRLERHPLRRWRPWGVPAVLIDHTALDGDRPAGSFMKQAKIRSLLLLRAGAPRRGTVTTEHAKSQLRPDAGARCASAPSSSTATRTTRSRGGCASTSLGEDGRVVQQNESALSVRAREALGEAGAAGARRLRRPRPAPCPW